MPFLNLNAPERVLLLAACGVLLVQASAPGFGGSGLAARSPAPCMAMAAALRVGGIKAGEHCMLRAAAGL